MAAQHHGAAAARAVFSDDGATGGADAVGHRPVGVAVEFMAGLDFVVQLDVVLDHVVAQRVGVDGGICADIYVVSDHHAAALRDLDVDPALVGEAKAVGSDPAPEWMMPR